jgi:hypothetical protein
MPALLIRHHVADFDSWKEGFDGDALTRQANGSRGGWIFRDAADPNVILVLLEWDDIERARLFVASDNLVEVITRSGVVGEPAILFLEEVGCPTA